MGGCISAMPSRRSRSLSAALVEGADEELSPSLTLPAPVGVPRHRGGGASSPPRDALFSPSGDGRRESSSHRRRSSAASSGPGRPGPVVPSVGSAGNDDDHAFAAKYELAVRIGTGASAECWECVNNTTGEHYAVKIMSRRKVTLRGGDFDKLLKEVKILREVRHRNIVELVDVFHGVEQVYVVTELVQGGELFEYIVNRGRLAESEASRFVQQMLAGVNYLHSKGVVHRDLKPENILITERTPDAVVKIIDFGSSVVGGSAGSILGTLGYVAPEVLRGESYGFPVDLWATGCIAFILLTGVFPFANQEVAETAGEAEYKLQWPDDMGDDVSDSARDLVRRLLIYDPQKRLTAKEALLHPWVQGFTAREVFLGSPARFNSTLASRAARGAARPPPVPSGPDRVRQVGRV